MDMLHDMGISMGLEEFKIEALSMGSPEVLAANLAYMASITDSEEEAFIYAAVKELWKRHLGYEESVEERLANFIDETIDIYTEHEGEFDRTFLNLIYARIRDFYLALVKEDGLPDIDLYNAITWHTHNDFEAFLLQIPHEFAIHGMIEEAINIGKWFADISSNPANFLRDLACILAEAGRQEEALAQVRNNLQRFPRDIWVIINAGDVMETIGQVDKAEHLFLKAKEMATNINDRIGVLERLIELYEKLQDKDKLRDIKEEYRRLTKRG